MADLELKDTAATLMKGSRQVRLVRAITIIRMICPGVQMLCFFSLYWGAAFWVVSIVSAPPYQIPSSPRRLVTMLAAVIRMKPTTDWNRPMAVALANWELVIPARYTKVLSTSQ